MREANDQFSSEDSSVRVLQYYIGDAEDGEDHVVRAVVEEINEEPVEEEQEEPDSGADAAIFPVTWMSDGAKVKENAGRRLRDAQGRVIPTLRRRDVEVHLKDLRGRDVCLKERVTISTGISQPILCYGKLMESGWSLDAQQQVMYHPEYDTKIPVNMQHRSLAVKGHIRMIQEEPHMVRMMKAHLNESL